MGRTSLVQSFLISQFLLYFAIFGLNMRSAEHPSTLFETYPELETLCRKTHGSKGPLCLAFTAQMIQNSGWPGECNISRR